MKLQKWLVVARSGSCKVTARRPALLEDEIALRLDLTLPDALFVKPTLAAAIVVPDDAALPAVIDADVVEQIGEAIRAATGLRVELVVRDDTDA